MSAKMRGVAVLKRVKTLVEARRPGWPCRSAATTGLLSAWIAVAAAVLDDHPIAAAVADALDDAAAG